MARTPRDFEESPMLKGLAIKMVDTFPELLEGVNPDDIFFAMCVSKQPSNSKPVIIAGVTSPLSRKVSQKPWQIAFYAETWERWTDARRNAEMLHVLYSIGEDEGKYRKPDIQDFRIFIRTLGTEWDDDNNAELLDVLKDAVHFYVPDTQDDGSSTDIQMPNIDPTDEGLTF
jgi:hypothetical protein